MYAALKSRIKVQVWSSMLGRPLERLGLCWPQGYEWYRTVTRKNRLSMCVGERDKDDNYCVCVRESYNVQRAAVYVVSCALGTIIMAAKSGALALDIRGRLAASAL